MKRYSGSRGYSLLTFWRSLPHHKIKQSAWLILAALAVLIEGYFLPALSMPTPAILVAIIIVAVFRFGSYHSNTKMFIWIMFLALVLDASSLQPIGPNILAAIAVLLTIYIWRKVGLLATSLPHLLLLVATAITVETVVRLSAASLITDQSMSFDLSLTVFNILWRAVSTTVLVWLALKFMDKKRLG